MKKTSLIVLLLIIAGCGRSLKNSWSDFTAYYNTFYNAKKEFRAGVAEVNDQPIQIDANQPIRPHPQPPLAGSENFENAIDDAAQILRRFSKTKWTDDALLLIGKSYYYLREYFLARQKFEELLSLPQQTALKQQAVIWKARTLLDISAYSQGVQFLQNQLKASDEQWTPTNRAEAQILLAEHLTMLQQYGEAQTILSSAIDQLEMSPLKGRSYFLLAQLFEINGDLLTAYQAYTNVKRYFPDYQYIYLAQLKSAEVSRRDDKIALASSIYSTMLRDDKNFEHRDEINYQLAETYKVEEKFELAEETYKNILGNMSSGDQDGLLAETYFQLGQLYRDHYNNYELAAAYFDSASSRISQPAENNGNDAGKLASAFGQYVSLRKEIARADSLLALGSLTEAELNEKLILIRRQRRENMKASQNLVQQTRNTLANTAEQQNIYEATDLNASAGTYGFLNYRNPERIEAARRQFIAAWGRRPRVDNWRRREAVVSANVSSPEEVADSTLIQSQGPLPNDEKLGINLEEIPRAKADQQRLRQERLSSLYRLGSLFFLTINQSDSAAYYYRRILGQSPPADLQAQTLYSLYELYKLKGQADSTQFYENRIVSDFPKSRYATQIREKAANTAPAENDSTTILRQKVQQLLDQQRNTPNREIAVKLRELALDNRDSQLAPSIYYEAIKEYIEYAKFKDRSEIDTDSIAVSTPDSSLNGRYSNQTWSRVKEWLQNFKTLFPSSSESQKISIWQQMLEEPNDIQPVATCSDLGVDPQVVPSREAFLKTVTLPDNISRMNLSGSVRYRVLINRKGGVESYELLSNPTNLGIEEAYENAIEKSLQFQPITQSGQAVRISCELEFPIKQ